MKMKLCKSMGVVIAAGIMTAAWAQAGPGSRPKTAAHKPSKARAAASDPVLLALQSTVEAQQKQIEELKGMMQQLVQSNQQALSNAQQAQSSAEKANAQAQQVQAEVTLAQKSADHAEFSAAEAKTKEQLDSDASGKKVGEIASLMGRFRFGGDLRVRGESIIQSYAGCPTGACEDRDRARFRLRFGTEGKLNEDFIGGFYLATGIWNNGSPSLSDPLSTNETLNGFFERKTIAVDRAWLTYQPQSHKWIKLTGGKFAYDWQRVNQTFDPDLNPEGFSEKFSFDLTHAGVLKNVTVQSMQLLFNEVAKGRDAKAIGGQFLTKWQPVQIWTITPSFTLLDWSNVDAIANAAFPVPICTTAVTTTCIPQVTTTAVGAVVNVPRTASVTSLANAVTNSTRIVGTGTGKTRAFASRFTYADLVVDNLVTTPYKRFPVHVVFDYENNLRAANNRNELYCSTLEFGQQKDKHDLLFGYLYDQVDQDAVISPFGESDQRTQTNVIQHKFYAGWMLARNTQALFTWWHGRVQDATLQNAPIFAAPFNPKTQQDPYLNRLQFDVIYKF
jgi:putative porin